MSLIGSVLYRRFHCTLLILLIVDRERERDTMHCSWQLDDITVSFAIFLSLEANNTITMSVATNNKL